MRFLRRVFGGEPPRDPDEWVTTLAMGGSEHVLQTVGESHYQPSLQWACDGTNADGPNHPRVLAELIPEPRNPHDPNAVRVQVGGRLVGYLAREDAAVYQPVLLRLAQHGALTCEARIKGGYAVRDAGFRASLGIELFVGTPEDLAATLATEAES